jgi:CRISPR system Cascade subunit CasC
MVKKSHLYVDVHVLQTVPPSCVNRDDTGSPKTAVYGGAVRARVSSQAWKRAVRSMFMEEQESQWSGRRTKRLVEMVVQEMQKLGECADAEKKAVKVLEAAGLKMKDEESGALFFMSRAQAAALAGLAQEDCTDKKVCKQALFDAPAVDMALFGRMVADDASLNYDAAVQVAHAISTHAVHNEYDYFTAVDDCAPEDNAGAGHLGTVEFNSATLYRYATVDVTQLMEHLGKKDVAEYVCGFLDAFVRAMPTGKQNTFANRTLPDDIYVAIRCDQPVNLVGAFEKPVAGKDGYVEASERRFTAFAKQTYAKFAAEPVAALAVGEAMEALAPVMSMAELLKETGEQAAAHLPENEAE